MKGQVDGTYTEEQSCCIKIGAQCQELHLHRESPQRVLEESGLDLLSCKGHIGHRLNCMISFCMTFVRETYESQKLYRIKRKEKSRPRQGQTPTVALQTSSIPTWVAEHAQ